MAVLSNGDRLAVWTQYMAAVAARREAIPITKADLRAAIDAADAWADSNAAEYNTALPQPARGALTAKQKAEMLMFVIRRRWEIA